MKVAREDGGDTGVGCSGDDARTHRSRNVEISVRDFNATHMRKACQVISLVGGVEPERVVLEDYFCLGGRRRSKCAFQPRLLLFCLGKSVRRIEKKAAIEDEDEKMRAYIQRVVVWAKDVCVALDACGRWGITDVVVSWEEESRYLER